MRNITCIICPKGCGITVEETADGLKVQGNVCPRGEKYAIEECTHPVRTVTSFIRVANREDTMVSVKTESPISKDKIFDIMKLIREKSVEAPVIIGDVIIENVFGTNVIATKDVK